MFKYKLLVSDLDGTLFNRCEQISPENYEAIKQMNENGVEFAISSGRSFVELPKCIIDNTYIRYIIHSNGSVVIDRQNGTKTYNCINNNQAVRLINLLNSYSTHLTLRANGKSYVDSSKQNDEAFKRYNLQTGHMQLLKDFADYLDDFDSFCNSLENLEMVLAFFENDDDMLECEKRLLETGEFLVARAIDHNLEICSINAGKGNALKKLASLINIEICDTVAVGDSANDITALQTAGLGVAVSNACDSLKAVADKVVCSNEEHAIKYIWENL